VLSAVSQLSRFERGEDMTEIEEIEALQARLAKLREVGERIDQRRLEADDWPIVAAVFSELIDQVEPGQEEVVIELWDDEQACTHRKRGNAANSADTTSEDEAKRGAHGGARPLDPRR
jgi:hypothetical protein